MAKEYRKLWTEMETEVNRGIDQLRREDFKLQIVDIDGKPVPGAEVKLVQTGHEFDFGCNCLWLGQKGAENERYEELLAGIFNLVTTTFCLSDIETEPRKWRFHEGSEEVFRRPPPDRVAAFARKNNMKIKGQPLMAGSWYPAWAKEQNLDESAIKALYLDYFRRVAERYGEVYDIFDLVNEALCHVKFPLYTPELEYVEWAFREAYPLFPRRITLELNEATGWVFDNPVKSGENRYYNMIRKMVDDGVKIDSLGFQFHLWNAARDLVKGEGRYTFDRVAEQLAAFAELGIPMVISEITVPSIIGDWEEGVCDEELQADLVDKFYRLFYSTPGVTGVLYWNLCDGAAWRSEGGCRGGLVDEFLRKKPAYLALEQLLKREWLTALENATDEGGQIQFRGFRGRYEITVKGNGTCRNFQYELGRSDTTRKLTLI